ncbi:MAG: class I SAM-dependent methyltransferase [Halobacteriales archaeon]
MGGCQDEFAEGEWERLDRDPVRRLEFRGTVDDLDEHLPAGGRVLDAGGGPGRYAIWLAGRGHEVSHCDLSGEQVRIAREKAAEHGGADAVECRQADLRALPYPDDSFDAVCSLGGALSHVLDGGERATAVDELVRVARPGAPVAVSVIGLLGAVVYGIRHETGQAGILPELLATGDYTADLLARHDADGWAEAHYFRVDEFESLLSSRGLSVERIIGLEGPATATRPELEGADEDARAAVRDVVESLRDDRAAAEFSEHVLAVARV